jgi:hypothetical protein
MRTDFQTFPSYTARVTLHLIWFKTPENVFRVEKQTRWYSSIPLMKWKFAQFRANQEHNLILDDSWDEMHSPIHNGLYNQSDLDGSSFVLNTVDCVRWSSRTLVWTSAPRTGRQSKCLTDNIESEKYHAGFATTVSLWMGRWVEWRIDWLRRCLKVTLPNAPKQPKTWSPDVSKSIWNNQTRLKSMNNCSVCDSRVF